MKKIIASLLLATSISMIFTGCNQSDMVEYNLSKEADNFNVIRKLTVINCIEGDLLFEMTGKMSVHADVTDNQLEVIVENEYGQFQKHFIGLSNNVTYVIEQLNVNDTSNYKYTLNYNPKMWTPLNVGYID